MTRSELGLRLQQWHSSMGDPIYAVGSFYFDNQVYPDKEIVERCISNLERDLDQFKRMMRDEPVMVRRNGRDVDLRKFAGYTNGELIDHIYDLEEIVSEVKRFMKEDYDQ